MSTGINNNQQRKLDRLNWRASLGILLLSLLVIACTLLVFVPPSKSARADNTSFTFTETGDYGQTSNTSAVLQHIGGAGPSFNLGLGDFNYSSSTVTGEQWSSYAQTNLGSSSFPFDIVAGDHDTNDLADLEKYLPPNLTSINISGTYGEQYYFDYPAGNPLARFIMVSPAVKIKNKAYDYTKTGADYQWVSQRITEAKNAKLWVLMGMAEGCIYIYSTSGNTPCPDGDLFNLLVSMKVDLVLQAHVHNYQRSKQFTLNSNCSSIPTDGSYNSNCVGAPSDNMTQGNGTVVVNDGTGGRNLVDFLNTDQKAGYFRTKMGSTVNPTFGFSQFTVSASQISMQFIPVVGSYRDSFTITSTGSPTTIGQDNFLRSNQQFWGIASDGQTWGGNANSSRVFSISNNTGLVTGTATNNYFAILGPGEANATAQFSGSISSLGNGAHIGAVLRRTDNQNWYEAYIDGTNLMLQKKVAGTMSRLGTFAFPATAGTSYTLLFNVSGGTLNASVWPTIGGSQPVNWMLTRTDTSLASGNCGLHVTVQSGVRAQFTSFQSTTP